MHEAFCADSLLCLLTHATAPALAGSTTLAHAVGPTHAAQARAPSTPLARTMPLLLMMMLIRPGTTTYYYYLLILDLDAAELDAVCVDPYPKDDHVLRMHILRYLGTTAAAAPPPPATTTTTITAAAAAAAAAPPPPPPPASPLPTTASPPPASGTLRSCASLPRLLGARDSSMSGESRRAGVRRPGAGKVDDVI